MSELAERGDRRLEWAREHMPVLASIREDLKRSKALKGLRIGMALHTEAKTGVLALSLREAGAKVRLASCNPLSTDDSVAAALGEVHGLEVYARKWQTTKEYYESLHKVLDLGPDLVIDDGADLISLLHTKRTELLDRVRGGNEETTTGVIRLRAMERDGVLRFPVIAVNDSDTKHLFDNRYGTGQSTVDGILRATNVLFSGLTVVVAGYGWCGRGVAMRAHGHGARVVVCEVNPIRALEAAMDGFAVMPMADAAKVGDVFVTVTGDLKVIGPEHFRLMKDGAILCNSGHFDVEIDLPGLRKMTSEVFEARPSVQGYRLKEGKTVYILAEGRLVNLGAAEGHPASVMDMSFANQALAAEYLVNKARTLQPKVYRLPEELDREIARLKLAAMGLAIDILTDEQAAYLASWREGT